MKDEKTKIRQEKIIELVSSFCDEKLDEEYKELSIKLVEKLGRKHDVPFKRGKVEIWASAIIYALGQINFLFDESFKPYATPDDICNYFNTKKSTVSNKARDIREMLNMSHYDNEFSTEYLLERQPTFYIDEESGLIIPESQINPMDPYFDRVYELFEKGEIDNAIEMLDVIDEDNPEYERAMFYKSFILNASGIKDDSSEIFNEFLSEIGKDIDLNDLLNEDDEIDENDPEELFAFGQFNHDIGEYEDAIDYYDRSLDILPNQINVLHFKALALCELKKYKKALKTIDKAIELDPNDYSLLNTKGLIYKQKNNIKKAIKFLNKANEIEENEHTWQLKGDIYHEEEKFKKALKCYDKSIEINPEEISTYICKTKVYMDMNDIKNAEKMLNEAEKIDENDVEFLCEKGNFLLSQDKLSEAVEYYDKCLEIDDEYVEALLFKAMACANLNREKEMEKCLDKIIEINPLLLMELDEMFGD